MATRLIRMIKKAAFPLTSRANRRTPHRNYTSTIFSTPLKTSTTLCTDHHFSALAETEKRFKSDDTLLSVIESEINFSEEKFHEFPEVPREFPFEIVDNAGEYIILTREYEGEKIKVKVHGPHNHSADSSDDEEEEENDHGPYVFLNVCVTKKSGRTLEFNIAAYADVIEISGCLHVKNPDASSNYPSYEQPRFSHLDEKLQKAFFTYLQIRGIEPSIGKFLYDYMVQRKHTKYTTWLKYLKNFIANTSNSNNTINLSRQASQATLIEPHYHNCALANKKSNANGTLLRVIESLVDRAEEKIHEFSEAPKVFPFEIEEKLSSTILTREYPGEEIKVKVRDESYYPPQYSYSLIGSVSNQSGLNLEFDITAHSEDGISIKSLVVENPNDSEWKSPFRNITPSHLDEDLQKAFRTYLEDRGIIEPSIGKIIHDFMVKRKHKIYIAWLKSFKNFIAD